MTACCTSSAYYTGRIDAQDSTLFRPGGLGLTTHALELAQLPPGARILDLGCGSGETLRILRQQGYRATGIDSAPPPFTDPACRSAVAEALPFADDIFDAVIAECSLSLFNNRRQALAECARVLVDGGRLILSDLYARTPASVAAVRSLSGTCVSGLLVREELDSELSQAGFAVDAWEDHSRALRECAAHYILAHGSLDGMWECGGSSSAEIEAAMRAARAGYFLLIATRKAGQTEKRSEGHE